MKDSAVTDVLGSILLVGMTVGMMASLSILILNMPGPPDELQADLQVRLLPGAGGWDNGDEIIQIQHKGGEALAADGARIVLVINSVEEVYTGTGLDQGFADGELTIGETWTQVRTLPLDTEVEVRVIVAHASSSRLAIASVLETPSSGLNPCITDVTPPTTVLWDQAPSIVSTSHTGPVTVTVALSDNCSGVDQTVPPRIYYRVNDGSVPPWIDGGVMALTGSNTWSTSIPDQGWASQGGNVFEYYIDEARDANGNVLTSSIQSQTISVTDPCIGETVPPTVSTWLQNPSDVSTQTSGSISITATVIDDCSGVDTAVAPHLHWRIGAAAFQDAGAMSLVGGTTFQGTIPAQTWLLFGGQTLQYYVGGMTDLNANVGDSVTQSDLIQVQLVYTYVNANTPTRGTVSDFANMQSATDGGAAATLSEAAQATGGSSTVSLSANGIVNAGGYANPSRVFTGDLLYAADTSGSGSTIRVTVADAAASGTITKVEIKSLGYVSQNNGRFALAYCLGGCVEGPEMVPSVSIPGTLTWDVTSQRSWTWADINNMDIQSRGFKSGGGPNPNFFVDHMYVVVTYSQATYDANVQFDFTGVPSGSSHFLQLRYQVAGDTFRVQVYDSATTLWNTRGSTLTAGSMTDWDYSLTASEYNSGAPRFRIVDVTPLGTTQGTVQLDYARVLTQ